MNISEIFIRRPVMTTLTMVAILMVGVIGYRTLPINALPNVDFPTIQVTAGLPGASPETMAASVATPLEKQFSTIAGIESMNSTSSLGQTQITLQFTLNRNIDAAAQDVQAAITASGRLLPSTMPSPPSYQKVNPANQPVLYLALRSATLPLSQVDEYAETYVAQHISMVGGVAQVQVFGQQKYAVRAQLDPRTLAARGIGLDEVGTAIAAANVRQPTGTLYGRYKAFNVQSNDQLLDAQAYRQLIVTWRNGSPVRLRDLGEVVDSVENDKIAAWQGRERAVLLAVQRQPGTNTVEVVSNIRRALPNLVSKIPASAQVEVLYDLSDSIRESVNDVQYTLAFTVFLVVAVIFLFLRSGSATIIASMALPMSIVGTFAAMSLLGYSLNNLTLMALTLSVGFVVDDAIVVLENIVRHLEEGEGVFAAALQGSREIGFTILSMTLSLVAVFIPVLFMGGIIGRLFQEFSVTISVAILVSGVVSLTLTPMLCSLMLKPQSESVPGRLSRWFEAFFDSWLALYDVTLRLVLRMRALTLILSFVLLGVTVWMFMRVPKGFIPAEDTGQITVYTMGAQSSSFADMVRHQRELAEIVQADPNVRTCVSTVGTGGAQTTTNSGSVLVYLKPRHERRLSADQVMEELRPKLATVPGIQAFVQNPPAINVGGQLTQSLYQFSMQTPDTATLYEWTPVMLEKVRAIPGLRDVTSDMQIESPQVKVVVNRDKASLMGVTADQVDLALGSAYGSRQVSTIYAAINEYYVILEVAPQFYRDPNLLSLLYVRSSTGKLVPLSTVAEFQRGVSPLLVNHLGQLPSATISFNLEKGASLSEVLPRIEAVASQTLPRSISTSFQGTAQAFNDSFHGLWALLILAILVIYIVLGILYESFIHPVTILAGLPSAGLGALITLRLFGLDLDIYGFLGLIMLLGIVKKNAIMMIDFALDEERGKGRSPEESIYAACLVRFRPIMMTTMAALMGSVPIAVGIGAGAESRQPLGLAVVGGLLVSQLLTLYITPVVYIYMDRLVSLFRGERSPESA